MANGDDSAPASDNAAEMAAYVLANVRAGGGSAFDELSEGRGVYGNADADYENRPHAEDMAAYERANVCGDNGKKNGEPAGAGANYDALAKGHGVYTSAVSNYDALANGHGVYGAAAHAVDGAGGADRNFGRDLGVDGDGGPLYGYAAEERGRVEDWLSLRASREQADAALRASNVPSGAYCVRESADPTVVAVLCVRFGGDRVGHFRLTRADGGGVVLIDGEREGGAAYPDVFGCIGDLKRRGRGAALVGHDLGVCVGSDVAV